MTAVLYVPPAADVTTLDHDQILARLADLLLSLYPWLAIEKADHARMHLEGMAHLSDQFIFLVQRLGRGSRLLTADQRQDILALVKLLGYRPRGASAATAIETFTIAQPATSVVYIPAGSIVRTEERLSPRRFQVLATAAIDVGQTSTTALVEHSSTSTAAILSTDVPLQSYRMTDFPYLDHTIAVSTPAGVWTEVDNFLATTSTDRHYTTGIDARDRVTVNFGGARGVGVIPNGLITFNYKIGGGAAGNVGAGALTLPEFSVVDQTGVVQQMTVTNGPTTPGYDRESGAEIQTNAPGSLTIPRSAVSRPDYEVIAERMPGIAFALMLTKNQNPAIGENEGVLVVVPDDGSVPSEGLLTTVAASFGDAVSVGPAGLVTVLPAGPTPKTVTFQLHVRAPTYVTVDLYARLYLRRGAVPSVVKAAVEAAYAQYFAVLVPAASVGMGGGGMVRNPRLNFGYYLQDVDGQPTGHLPYSDLYNLVHDVPGVREVGAVAGEFTLNGIPTDVQLSMFGFPRPGVVTLVLT